MFWCVKESVDHGFIGLYIKYMATMSFYKMYYFCICDCFACMHVCMYALHVYTAHGGRSEESLKLGLHMVMKHHILYWVLVLRLSARASVLTH